ncbi:MAG: DUF4399 domain-containing protein [Xanthomonadaceae bacterium]|nr:DUF4399 domain-containing protein [Xanthomonadaceae bacterium]
MPLFHRLLLVFALFVPLAASAQSLPRTPSPAGAEVYIIAPADGAVVGSEVTVRFGLKGMGIAPAGTAAANSGHHHLLIDAPMPALDQPIPADAQHVHFGKGQTETTVTLTPGKHTLQLLLGDQNHIPHEPPVVSQVVTVTVK